MKNIKQSAKAVRQFVTVEESPDILVRLTKAEAKVVERSMYTYYLSSGTDRALVRKVAAQLRKAYR